MLPIADPATKISQALLEIRIEIRPERVHEDGPMLRFHRAVIVRSATLETRNQAFVEIADVKTGDHPASPSPDVLALLAQSRISVDIGATATAV